MKDCKKHLPIAVTFKCQAMSSKKYQGVLKRFSLSLRKDKINEWERACWCDLYYAGGSSKW